jgi:chorismate dehydratase
LFHCMSRLRISAISYLNTAPLMWSFEHGDAGRQFDISYTVPSNCAAQLAEGAADIGIIPVAAYATIPGLVIIPGIAIAVRTAVRSILLVTRVPLERVGTVALDTSSLTSAALTRILFSRFWGGTTEFLNMEPDLERMLERADAAMIIGDPALSIDRSRYSTYDLAEEWIRLTGCPFVPAFWAVREAALRDMQPSLDLARIFQQSSELGLQPENLEIIAREWAPKVGLSEADVKSYLTVNIHYDLDPSCLAGLQLYYSYAYECGALPCIPVLRFLGDSPASI